MKDFLPFAVGLPIYTMIKKMKLMEGKNLYERQILGKGIDLIEVPEGKIYLVDSEGNGTGKYPVFVPFSMSISLKTNDVEKVLDKVEEDTTKIEEEITKKTKTTKK